MKKYMRTPEGRRLTKRNFSKYLKEISRYKKGKYWCPRCKKYLYKKDFWSSKHNKYNIRALCINCEKIEEKEHRMKRRLKNESKTKR
jgi:hypothetical protein